MNTTKCTNIGIFWLYRGFYAGIPTFTSKQYILKWVGICMVRYRKYNTEELNNGEDEFRRSPQYHFKRVARIENLILGIAGE